MKRRDGKLIGRALPSGVFREPGARIRRQRAFRGRTAPVQYPYECGVVVMKYLELFGKWSVLGLIWVYRNCVSPWTPRTCRFTPSCSAYAREAVQRFGPVRGSWLSLKRLLRCHPFYKGALQDPVPDTCGPGNSLGVRKRHG